MDAVLFIFLLFGSCGIAAFAGGAPERIAAGLLLTAAIASGASGATPQGFKQVEWGVFAVDCALFVAMYILAMSANRYWPLWLTSLQLATVFSHLAVAAMGAPRPLAYAVTSTIWSILAQIILVIGTARFQVRKRQLNADPPWSGY